MKVPSAPKKTTWIIGLVCGILGIFGHYVDADIITVYNYSLLLIGFLVLAMGTSFKDI